MGDKMRPIPLEGLLSRSFAEYRAKGSIFDIPHEFFFRPEGRMRVFSTESGPPIGPAAGPHTQLAQNILSAYLVGGRYFELKTVQILDSLEVEKPCIDASDEGYNVEWSSEFSLRKAYDEYLKAWFVLHVFDFMADPDSKPSFHFNMSVGYDLEGIKSEKVDRFIDRLIDSSADELFDRYRSVISSLKPSDASGTLFEGLMENASRLCESIPPSICSSVTLSTMHGCPSDEIEAICAYMLTEKKLDTLVKLNPTLLGFDRVREILDRLGYNYVALDRSGFERDLQYKDAVPMLRRLQELASEQGRFFGAKLSNTLATVNRSGVLPGKEMYLSGRALYPLTINLAAQLGHEFGSELPISFSGGISAWNLGEVIGAGLRPVTVATDLLRPGGYGRLKELAQIADREWSHLPDIDPSKVAAAAAASLTASHQQKGFRGTHSVSVDGVLPLTDCFVAPCISNCPIAQDIPDYIHLVGAGRYEEAFAVIYERNPLPFMTGYLCDHACEENCTRIDWEGGVNIREIKRIAAERGYAAFRKSGTLAARRGNPRGARAAIIGAGPAGLSAASFLAREGFEVHLYEREDDPGGVIRHVIPDFRVPPHVVEREVSLLQDLGVVFHFGWSDELGVKELKRAGYKYVLAAVGAELDRDVGIEGATEVLEFLRTYRRAPSRLRIGPTVAVIGAGDTAMDAARAAARCTGVQDVTVIYRRAQEQMPALPEEYELAVADGVAFHFLRSPVRWEGDSGVSGGPRDLVCEIMELGEPDRDGRLIPVPTGEFETYSVDSVITAIGTDVDAGALRSMGVEDTMKTGQDGVFLIGDAATGASTIVKAIASARRVADTILAREGEVSFDAVEIDAENPVLLKASRDRIIPMPESGVDDDELRSIESQRCLGCRAVCVKCVEVCPNRANTFIEVDGYTDRYQIIHLDAFCNECGNCDTFCPWEGKPYVDKFTVFSTLQDFDGSRNAGFFLENGNGTLRHNGTTTSFRASIESGTVDGVADEDARILITSIVRDYSYLLDRVLE